ncbi:MAG: nucleotidyltransferase domain-containing protein [Candidatus Daviesbacteria bacterium]
MTLDINSILEPLKKIEPDKIILFGSYAYGNSTKDSDIDLLVVLDTPNSFHQRIQQIRPLLPKNQAIDLIVLTPTEYQQTKNVNPLVKEIDTKGKVIYE